VRAQQVSRERHLSAGRDLALLAGQDSTYAFLERKNQGDFGRHSLRSDERTGITSMASNAAINTINSKGDLGQALKLTFSDTALKGYVTAALAAGITSGVIDKAFAGETNPVTGATAGHNLNTLAGVGNFAAHQASRAAVSAALDAAINGGSFEEKLAAALTSAAVHTVSAAGQCRNGCRTRQQPDRRCGLKRVRPDVARTEHER